MAHRHLIGIDSPPDDHEADNMTSGPVLPAGWDGDAWKCEGTGTNSYWLRAWNKETGQYAVAQASTYESAQQLLQDSVAQGGSGKVTISFTEQKPK